MEVAEDGACANMGHHRRDRYLFGRYLCNALIKVRRAAGDEAAHIAVTTKQVCGTGHGAVATGTTSA